MSSTSTSLKLFSGALVALCLACGGGGVDVEEVADVQLDVMNEMADILEGVTDSDSLEAAKPKMRELGEELAEHMKEWAEQAKQGVDDAGAAQKMAEMSGELMEAQQRMQAAAMKLAMNPELSAQAAELMQAMADAMPQDMR